MLWRLNWCSTNAEHIFVIPEYYIPYCSFSFMLLSVSWMEILKCWELIDNTEKWKKEAASLLKHMLSNLMDMKCWTLFVWCSVGPLPGATPRVTCSGVASFPLWAQLSVSCCEPEQRAAWPGAACWRALQIIAQPKIVLSCSCVTSCTVLVQILLLAPSEQDQSSNLHEK